MADHGLQWLTMVNHGWQWQWLTIVENSWQWLTIMVDNDNGWPAFCSNQLADHGWQWQWLTIVDNGWLWLTMVGNDNGWQWLTMVDIGWPSWLTMTMVDLRSVPTTLQTSTQAPAALLASPIKVVNLIYIDWKQISYKIFTPCQSPVLPDTLMIDKMHFSNFPQSPISLQYGVHCTMYTTHHKSGL